MKEMLLIIFISTLNKLNVYWQPSNKNNIWVFSRFGIFAVKKMKCALFYLYLSEYFLLSSWNIFYSAFDMYIFKDHRH